MDEFNFAKLKINSFDPILVQTYLFTVHKECLRTCCVDYSGPIRSTS